VPGLANGTSYSFTVKATNGHGSSSASSPSAPVAVSAQGGPQFHPLTPTRIVDSRDGTGTPRHPWSGGETRALPATGVGGVPASHVSAIVANVTVTDASSASHLTVWPTGQPMPTASSVNFEPGQTVANHVTVGVGTGGDVSVFNNAGSTAVIVDVLGYYDDGTVGGGSAYVATTPTRLLDTRDGTGGLPGSFGAKLERDLTVAGGSSPVPAGATAVVLNVTGVFPSDDTHLTVWPSGQPAPLASSLNLPRGGVVANLVTVKVGTGGKVRIRNNAGDVNVVADVVGYFTAQPAGGRFVSVTPHRLLDTRDGTGRVANPVFAFEELPFHVAGDGGVPPAGASAVVLNVTVVGPSDDANLTCWSSGEGKPLASNVNVHAGQTVANQVIVRLDAPGDVSCSPSQGQADLVADVVGYFT
jgi:hypothetical protein